MRLKPLLCDVSREELRAARRLALVSSAGVGSLFREHVRVVPPVRPLPAQLKVSTHAARELVRRFPSYSRSWPLDDLSQIANTGYVHEVRTPGKAGATADLIVRNHRPVWDTFQLVVADHGDYGKIVTVEFSDRACRFETPPGRTSLMMMRDALMHGLDFFSFLERFHAVEMPDNRRMWGNMFVTGDTSLLEKREFHLALLSAHEIADLAVLLFPTSELYTRPRVWLNAHVSTMCDRYGLGPALRTIVPEAAEKAAELGARIYDPSPGVLASYMVESLLAREVCNAAMPMPRLPSRCKAPKKGPADL